MLSPPLDMKEKWFAPHIAYTIAKFGMSMVVLGLAGELRAKGIAVNALWPRTVIATAAVQNLLGGDADAAIAQPDIVADAAYAVFAKPARQFTGHFLIDDTFLAENGVTDFDNIAPTRRKSWRRTSLCPMTFPRRRASSSRRDFTEAPHYNTRRQVLEEAHDPPTPANVCAACSASRRGTIFACPRRRQDRIP